MGESNGPASKSFGRGRVSVVGAPRRSLRGVGRKRERATGVLSTGDDSGRTGGVDHLGATEANRLAEPREPEPMNPVEMDDLLTETVTTPVGDEVVFPGWQTRPTVEMKTISPALIAACRDLPPTVPSMPAVKV